MKNKIKYSEIFHSIQGEGSLSGTPSVFFRTSFCNLKCSWCDTPYTSHEPENKDISIDDALMQILSYNCQYIVITGGEPFIQRQSLEQLCYELNRLGKHITIETNGTIFYPLSANLISCSPKTLNSTPTLEQVSERVQATHEKKRYNPDAIRRIIDNFNYQFKFVIELPKDILEVDAIVQTNKIDPYKVFLMPEGRTAAEIYQKEYWIIKECMKRNYKYSDRLHVKLWNDRRGV